jgi:hypothetical protein
LNICLLGPWVKRHVHGGQKIWKNILDQKKNHMHKNIFCSDTFGTSIFWKGVMWASQAVESVGNGKKKKDLGRTVGLAHPLYPPSFGTFMLYAMNNVVPLLRYGMVITQHLILTFTRNFSPSLMEQWYALEAIAHSICLTEDTNSLIWQYHNYMLASTLEV